MGTQVKPTLQLLLLGCRKLCDNRVVVLQLFTVLNTFFAVLQAAGRALTSTSLKQQVAALQHSRDRAAQEVADLQRKLAAVQKMNAELAAENEHTRRELVSRQESLKGTLQPEQGCSSNEPDVMSLLLLVLKNQQQQQQQLQALVSTQQGQAAGGVQTAAPTSRVPPGIAGWP